MEEKIARILERYLWRVEDCVDRNRVAFESDARPCDSQFPTFQ